ncbi:MAG: VTT domain-containing protein, partial [Cyanobacteria bacterium KgW148]|nr:VTT domain-containing protein [Cyanobacteria bacterium KgW148]
GLKIVLLTRLSPVFPFNLLNYAFGITSVSLKDYALGSVGMVPGTVLYVYVGSLGGNLAQLGSKIEPNPLLQWTIRTIGFAATLAVTLYITRLAQRELAKELES